MNFAQSCEGIGISRETLRLWRRANPSLSTDIAQAQAEAIRIRLDLVNDASKTNWRASAWMLERLCPEVWGRTRSLTVAEKRRFAYLDRSAAHDRELTPLEIDLRTALYLPANASDDEVKRALEHAKVNLLRSRAYGIPVDQLPK